MRVFKFGGASLKNAEAIRNMASIVKSYTDAPLLVVVSAMGKTTNALESVLNTFARKGDYLGEIEAIKTYHLQICQELFTSTEEITSKLNSTFDALLKNVNLPGDYDQVYDQVVSMGEVISSIIVAQYLSHTGMQSQWVDAKKLILTDATFREGKVQWKKTEERIATLRSSL